MNEEIKETQVEEEVVTVGNETPEGKTQEDKIPIEKPNVSTGNFTQEQVNDIVRARLERLQSRIFNRYGVKNKTELDELIGKAQSYQVMYERYGLMKDENSGLKQELAFLKNNINPERKDDIMAYFKGKEIEFSNDNLINELATHPEWLNPMKADDKPKTTIQVLGNGNEISEEKPNEKDTMAKYFGLSKFV